MKQGKLIFIISMILLLLAGSIAVAAGAGSPGSEDDPVVTKSYVDQKIAEIKGNGGGGQTAQTASVFQLVEVEAGKKILGGAGTEMILRGGEAAAVDNGVDGISDLTAGADLKGGAAITRNHLLLVPKNDGRGIEVKLKAWVMIKGEYTVE